MRRGAEVRSRDRLERHTFEIMELEKELRELHIENRKLRALLFKIDRDILEKIRGAINPYDRDLPLVNILLNKKKASEYHDNIWAFFEGQEFNQIEDFISSNLPS